MIFSFNKKVWNKTHFFIAPFFRGHKIEWFKDRGHNPVFTTIHFGIFQFNDCEFGCKVSCAHRNLCEIVNSSSHSLQSFPFFKCL